jgi:hypothetical protein
MNIKKLKKAGIYCIGNYEQKWMTEFYNFCLLLYAYLKNFIGVRHLS